MKGKKQADEKRGRGRPATHAEAWTRVSVILLGRQIAYLDHLAADIRSTTGAAINRAELIRAMIDAVEGARLDLTHTTSEADIRSSIMDRLKATKPD